MTQPQPAPGRPAVGYAPILRLIAVAATIACLVAGFVIAFTTPSATSFKDWIATGIISAGVALACLIVV